MSETSETRIAFDTIEFAFKILPWIAKETGLEFNPEKMERPSIDGVSGIEMNTVLGMHPLSIAPGGVYNGAINALLWNSDPFHNGHEEYSRSIIVHELTHYLQYWNGILPAYKSNQFSPELLFDLETQAYKTQQKYLREKMGEEGLKRYNMTDDGIQAGIQYSVAVDQTI